MDATDEAQDTDAPALKDGAMTGLADVVGTADVDAAMDASVEAAMDEDEDNRQLDAADENVAACEPPNPFGTYPNCVCCLP